MKDIISKIIAKISIAKILIAAGIAVTATTIALAIKALKKRLAAKKAKSVIPVQVIKLSELEEDKTFEDTNEEFVEEEPETDEFEDIEDAVEEHDEASEDVEETKPEIMEDVSPEIKSKKVNKQDTSDLMIDILSCAFSKDDDYEENEKSDIEDLPTISSNQELDEDWYKKVMSHITNDPSYLEEKDDEEEDEFRSLEDFKADLSVEDKHRINWGIKQCGRLTSELSNLINREGNQCPSEYYKLRKMATLNGARLKIIREDAI